ncbi:hypothetical protein SAMN04487961_2554 [Marinobacter pelagius]|uniref:Uncharacterized protein n=1 Tax=Marinobacter pelagius TaxID=379482 RepID=A0A1I4XFJ6_9GAMM|nr:hypothetical protein SAMN04487961_2554 [Marinobacter pelagius]
MKAGVNNVGLSWLSRTYLLVDAKIRIAVGALLTTLTELKSDVTESLYFREWDANEHDQHKFKRFEDQATFATAYSGAAARGDTQTDLSCCHFSSTRERVCRLSDIRSGREGAGFSWGTDASFSDQRQPLVSCVGAGLFRCARRYVQVNQISDTGERSHYSPISGWREFLSWPLFLDGTELAKCRGWEHFSWSPSSGNVQGQSQTPGDSVGQCICRERNKSKFGGKYCLFSLLLVSWFGCSTTLARRSTPRKTTSGVLGKATPKRTRAESVTFQSWGVPRTRGAHITPL